MLLHCMLSSVTQLFNKTVFFCFQREDKIRELNRRVLSKSQPKCVTIQTEESSDILVDHNPNPAKTNACVVSFTNLSPLTIGGGSPDDVGVSIDADSGLASSSMAKSSKNSASDSEPYCWLEAGNVGRLRKGCAIGKNETMDGLCMAPRFRTLHETDLWSGAYNSKVLHSQTYIEPQQLRQ